MHVAIKIDSDETCSITRFTKSSIKISDKTRLDLPALAHQPLKALGKAILEGSAAIPIQITLELHWWHWSWIKTFVVMAQLTLEVCE
jgi:hypothetical protein